MRALVILIILGAAHVASAYPQYQLSRDTTCTSCHLSPGGGGLLGENGLSVAGATARYEYGSTEFMYGKIDPPDWLKLGGDLRAAAGLTDNGKVNPEGFPMQGEVYASAGAKGFTVEVTGGVRTPQDGGSALHVLWSREHYVMWRQHPDEPHGLYVRAGRFMPVYGLRLAEHDVYTQRFGGSVLYGETYGGAVEYVSSAFEVHATGFVHDPIGSPIEHGDGAALYAEARIGEHAAVGVEGKYTTETDLDSTYGGMTAKLYLPGPELLLQAELAGIHRAPVTHKYNEMVGYMLATRQLGTSWLLDVGVGHYQKDLAVSGLYRDCLDVNVHWFMTSHVELLLTNRVERLGDGPAGGFSLAQLHYRL